MLKVQSIVKVINRYCVLETSKYSHIREFIIKNVSTIQYS